MCYHVSMANVKPILVYVDPSVLDQVDEKLAGDSRYSSRSHLIRRLLENWKDSEKTGKSESSS